MRAVHQADSMMESQILRWGSAWLTRGLPLFCCDKGFGWSAHDREKGMGSERESHRDGRGELRGHTDTQAMEGADLCEIEQRRPHPVVSAVLLKLTFHRDTQADGTKAQTGKGRGMVPNGQRDLLGLSSQKSLSLPWIAKFTLVQPNCFSPWPQPNSW